VAASGGLDADCLVDGALGAGEGLGIVSLQVPLTLLNLIDSPHWLKNLAGH